MSGEKFLICEFLAMLDLMAKTPKDSKEYEQILNNFAGLDMMGERIMNACKLISTEMEQVEGQTVMDEFKEPYEEPTPFPEQGSNESVSDVQAEKTYTLPEVREALGKAKASGVDLLAVLGEYGTSSVKGIPESAYADIMARFGDL